jgi:monoterpene epsilon-lactone hydrolase
MASWQAHLALWILKARVKRKLRGSRDVAGSRRALTPPRFPVSREVRIFPAAPGGVAGEWVETSGTAGPTLLYLHGGGYYACSAETHRSVTTTFARRHFRVFAPNYRLAPEHPFPAAVEDALAVYRGLLAAEPEQRIVFSGESAGGALALALIVALRDGNERLPTAAALFSPWLDLAAAGASVQTNSRRCAMLDARMLGVAAEWYLGVTDPRHPLASPLYADLAGLPPLLVHVGQDEVLLDDSIRLAACAEAAGVECRLKIWPVVPHAWQLFPSIPEARQSLDEAAEFLRAKAAILEAHRA